jgi:starvation-inducible DNA-binding protein
MFQTLHVMFETHYTELALAVDVIAERIRSLGMAAPGTYGDFVRLSSIKEVPGVPKAKEMIQLLVLGHEAVVRTARSIFPVVGKAADEASADLLTQRIQLHEKTAWMLRSLLED